MKGEKKQLGVQIMWNIHKSRKTTKQIVLTLLLSILNNGEKLGSCNVWIALVMSE